MDRNAEGLLEVTRPDDERQSRSLHGLTRTLVSNMVIGVTAGYEKKLEIVGSATAWWPRARLSLSCSRLQPPHHGQRTGGHYVLRGEAHGLHGLRHRQAGRRRGGRQHSQTRKPEPYKGKGVRYSGERVRRKVGKAGKK